MSEQPTAERRLVARPNEARKPGEREGVKDEWGGGGCPQNATVVADTQREERFKAWVFADIVARGPGAETVADLMSHLQAFRTQHTTGKMHYSVLVDAVFLYLFVAIHAADQTHPHLFSFASGGAPLWEAVRFLAVPQQPLVAIGEALGLPVPLRYATEAEYRAAVAARRYRSHSASASFCPYKAEPLAPPTLASYARLRRQMVGWNRGFPNKRVREAIYRALLPRIEAAGRVVRAESMYLAQDPMVMQVVSIESFDFAFRRLSRAEKAARRRRERGCQALGWPLTSALTYLLAAEFLTPVGEESSAAVRLHDGSSGDLVGSVLRSLFPLMVALATLHSALLWPLAVHYSASPWVGALAELVFYVIIALLLSRSLGVAVPMMRLRQSRSIVDLHEHTRARWNKDNAARILSSLSTMSQMLLLALTLFPRCVPCLCPALLPRVQRRAAPE